MRTDNIIVGKNRNYYITVSYNFTLYYHVYLPKNIILLCKLRVTFVLSVKLIDVS